MESPETHVQHLLRDLSRPEAYPDPVPGVEVIQTHASCVFLTGSFAYKIKKPVNLGFLDYSTLERRRECSEREVALNRRLCPKVYLDVIPIVEEAGRLRVGGRGGRPRGCPRSGRRPTIEWAVRMRQLPERDLVSIRLAEGRVTREQIERLAHRLAEFHAGAETSNRIRTFGDPAVIRANTEENFTQTEPSVDGVLPRDHFDAIRDATHRFLREHAALFHRRMAQDRIRDGHGDLRAQNIYLDEEFPGGVQILDCIEFNERFRYQDVAADLAYLAVDLDLAGRRDLREALVETYEQESGDADLLRLLPFYQCYRAYVRGKIALMAAAEPEIPAEQHAEETALAACAFDLARSYVALWASRPLLVMMLGPSGSGKSVLARELARRLPAILFSSDQVRQQIAVAPVTARSGESRYTPAAVDEVYEALRALAERSLRQGQHTILDATFLSGRERIETADLARRTGAALRIVECCCPGEVARDRIRSREAEGRDASEATVEVYELQARDRDPLEESLLPFHLAVDTTLPISDQCRAALRWIEGIESRGAPGPTAGAQ